MMEAMELSEPGMEEAGVGEAGAAHKAGICPKAGACCNTGSTNKTRAPRHVRTAEAAAEAAAETAAHMAAHASLGAAAQGHGTQQGDVRQPEHDSARHNRVLHLQSVERACADDVEAAKRKSCKRRLIRLRNERAAFK